MRSTVDLASAALVVYMPLREKQLRATPARSTTLPPVQSGARTPNRHAQATETHERFSRVVEMIPALNLDATNAADHSENVPSIPHRSYAPVGSSLTTEMPYAPVCPFLLAHVNAHELLSVPAGSSWPVFPTGISVSSNRTMRISQGSWNHVASSKHVGRRRPNSA